MVNAHQDAQGGGGPSGQQRVFSSERLFDPARNPPEFVDRQLPTFSVQLIGPGRGRGFSRAPRGGTIEGSYRVTGSWKELSAPGTFSLRIVKMNVFTGSREHLFYLRHSRRGTLDTIYFPRPGQHIAYGDGNRPLLVVPPGTLFWGWNTQGSGYWSGYSMEGLPS